MIIAAMSQRKAESFMIKYQKNSAIKNIIKVEGTIKPFERVISISLKRMGSVLT